MPTVCVSAKRGGGVYACLRYPAMVDEAGVRFLNDAFIPNPDDFLK